MRRPAHVLLVCTIGASLATLPGRASAQARAELILSVGYAPAHRIADGATNAVVGGLGLHVNYGHFRAGPVVTILEGQGPVHDSSVYFGGVAGYTTELSDGWRLAVLAEGGAHDLFLLEERRYTRSFNSTALRDDVLLPYAGLRCGVTYERQYERSWLTLGASVASWGLHLLVRRDLRDGAAVVDYWNWSVFYPAPRTSVSYAIGGWSAALALDLGMGW